MSDIKLFQLSGADATELAAENSFSRDVTNIGHWGTGNLEVNVRTLGDWEKARQLVYRA